MESKELRIGNLLFDRFGKTVIVESINELGINLNGGDGNGVYPFFEFKELKPILLTEEILLKCGFEWSIQHQSYKHKNFKYVIDFYNSHPQFNSSVCFLNKEHRSGENLICIHYLHQLQNLYFALTNTELTVNL